MRKRIVLVLLIVLMSVSLFANGTYESTEKANKQKTDTSMIASEAKALATVPIPSVSYFTERQTIARWIERWDKPSVVTYVYLISYGNILGYYVCNGKPASIQSYLVPESSLAYLNGPGYYNREILDIDGTYGTLNQGIRFFTAEGTAVEWGGSGATYLYSDVPLPLNVPKLNMEVNNGN